MVSREFKGSEELERKYGKEGVKSDRRGSGGITRWFWKIPKMV